MSVDPELRDLLAKMAEDQECRHNQQILGEVMREGELTIILRETLTAALNAAVGAAGRIHRAKMSLDKLAGINTEKSA